MRAGRESGHADQYQAGQRGQGESRHGQRQPTTAPSGGDVGDRKQRSHRDRARAVSLRQEV
ncbi:MAG TPA: hypothetical protein VN870_13515, partial [Streptosporangiaceae bacterium]|nr:hypothetical protein [Streptosporangiaceae bacterium]